MAVCEMREAWLLGRQKGLGGSDIAAVVGLSPFSSPIDIYMSKTEPVEFGEDIVEFMQWGNLLEPVIREEYARRAQCDVVHGSEIAPFYPGRSTQRDQQTIVHAAGREWMLGTPDGIMRNDDAGLEIKNVGFKGENWGKSGTDEIPDHYAIQCQWYIEITERPRWDVAPLFNGNRLETFRLFRNDDLIRELIAAGEHFWNDNVLRGIPPPLDESASYARYLGKKFSLAASDVLPADDAISGWARELRHASDEKKRAESLEQLAKNQLAELIGDFQKSKGDFGSVNWIRPKPGSRTNWEEVAKALNPPNELIAAHTSPVNNTPYIRAFWSKEQ